MTQRTQPTGSAPGEIGRPTTQLDRAPGERYAPPPAQVVLVPANAWLGLLFGMLATLGTIAAWGLLASILEIQLGLVVVAGVGGWVIGGAVAWGAWLGQPHAFSGRVRSIAMALAALAWLGGTYLAYLLALLLLPGSDLTFQQRLASQPFLDWLSPQFSALDIVAVLLLVVLAWRSAR